MREKGELYNDNVRDPNGNLRENCTELLQEMQATCLEYQKLSLNIGSYQGAALDESVSDASEAYS